MSGEQWESDGIVGKKVRKRESEKERRRAGEKGGR
jgi:hypothetical protein